MPVLTAGFCGSVVRSYVEGLQWVARYYWQGCVSWKWFYPFHYPPMAAMLVEIGRFHSEEVIASFQFSTPFHPFEQLMAVLPGASAHALPEPYHELMTSPRSPIADFYPTSIGSSFTSLSAFFIFLLTWWTPASRDRYGWREQSVRVGWRSQASFRRRGSAA